MKSIITKQINYKKCCIIAGMVIVIMAFCWATSIKANAVAVVNEDLSYTVTVDGVPIGALNDSNRSSYITLEAGQEVAITADTPFSHIYLVWNRPSGEYLITTENGEQVNGGEHGFLHDYTALLNDTTSVTIVTSESGAVLCDAYAFDGETPPTWVEQWQPTLEKADLLVLPTHADDEHLFFGGTLPTYAGERELAVQVVYLTNHWGEPYRPHELLNGLWTVGVTAYPVMGDFPDIFSDSLEHAQSLYGLTEVISFQVENIRRFKPEVIVGHDINGEYGHGVHMLNSYTILEALELSNNPLEFPESYETYGVWDVPKTYLHLWEDNPVVMDWGIPLERFDGATALDIAIKGFAEHTSQQTYFKVEAEGAYDCRLFGLARSTVGEDVIGGDFFENITLLKDIEPEKETEVILSPELDSPIVEDTVEDIVQKPEKQSAPILSNSMLAILAVFLLFVFLLAMAFKIRSK